MTIHFDYNKQQVIQALRYHFISRKEIRLMIILVNVFAIFSFVLYLLKYILPFAFIIGAVLWMVLMISFWFLMPALVYKRAATFKEAFSMSFGDDEFTLAHEKGSRSWSWGALNSWLESPNFFHLYFDSRSFFLVPKSGCKNPDEVNELRQLINARVKKG